MQRPDGDSTYPFIVGNIVRYEIFFPLGTKGALILKVNQTGRAPEHIAVWSQRGGGKLEMSPARATNKQFRYEIRGNTEVIPNITVIYLDYDRASNTGRLV